MDLCRKKLLSIWLAALALAALLPLQVQAVGLIDTGRPVTLTIRYECGGKTAPGVDFALYRVADASSAMELTLTGDFTAYPVSLEPADADAWQALAATLEGYIQRDGLKPLDGGRTDRAGTLVLPSGGKTLAPGLYLLLGGQYVSGSKVYTAEPSLVLLPAPGGAGTQWDYDVTVTPKYTVRSTGTSPGSSISRRVIKVWNDADNKDSRPQSVTIQLLQNGKVYDTVTLSGQNNWRYTWKDLDPRSQWTVAEREVPGYTVAVSRSGATFTVTNTAGPEGPGIPKDPEGPDIPETPKDPVVPKGPTLPQTGMLWWPVPVLAAAGILLIVVGCARGRKDEE